MAETNKKTEKTIKKFFDSLGIDTTFEVLEDEETIGVTLETEDTGIIIEANSKESH
jgi:predicted RNA-binding protein Jag